MPTRRQLTIGIWIILLVICIAVVAGARLSTDMAAFLPRSASLSQQVLTEQVRNGTASRLILVALEGAPPSTLADMSKAITARLAQDPEFVDVSNGDPHSFADVQEFMWKNRYLLAPDVTAGRFTVSALHTALENDLALLGSDTEALFKATLANDPTGEALHLMSGYEGVKRPHSRDGVWMTDDERRALLLVHTRAPGFDTDAQANALEAIRQAFDHSQSSIAGARRARLLESGPGVFAVNTRRIMVRDATRLSFLATTMAAVLLIFAYRSVWVLAIGLLPVLSGGLAGFTAVMAGFGFVHGITLGFGVTLIGESIDYAIYLIAQTAPQASATETLDRIWPTLRLGALTSIVGFSAMLFSSFVGFAQLGLFSIAGLVASACVTRFVLPELVPRDFSAPGAVLLGRPLLAVMRHGEKLKPLVGLLVLAAGVAFASVVLRTGVWDKDVSDLSPIPAADQQLDHDLRSALGVPDLRYLVVFRAPSEQQALEISEQLGATLRRLQAEGAVGSYDIPSQILPSDRTQRERQSALPEADMLRARFNEALQGLPFATGAFAPFLADVAAARKAPLLSRSSLPAALRLELDSMLFEQGTGWDVLVPLHDVADPARVASEVRVLAEARVDFVDLAHEGDQLLATYQQEATSLAAIGSLAILGLLAGGLRSPSRILRVSAPLAAAVIVTAAVLLVANGKLSIFMVVGFLLIVAVGSNYCLFFERSYDGPAERSRAVASIVLANLCTVSAYGLMSLSQMPVLHDMGITVAGGTLLTLFFSAILSTRSPMRDEYVKAGDERLSAP